MQGEEGDVDEGTRGEEEGVEDEAEAEVLRQNVKEIQEDHQTQNVPETPTIK